MLKIVLTLLIFSAIGISLGCSSTSELESDSDQYYTDIFEGERLDMSEGKKLPWLEQDPPYCTRFVDEAEELPLEIKQECEEHKVQKKLYANLSKERKKELDVLGGKRSDTLEQIVKLRKVRVCHRDSDCTSLPLDTFCETPEFYIAFADQGKEKREILKLHRSLVAQDQYLVKKFPSFARCERGEKRHAVCDGITCRSSLRNEK